MKARSLGAASACVLALAAASAAQEPSLVLQDGGVEFPDGSLQETAAGAYDHVLVVAPSGGHFTSIQEALDSVSGTHSQRYLVWVAPGTYFEEVTMESYVDIRGAGRELTRIIAYGSATGCTAGTVSGADHAELRSLTVRSLATGENCTVALYNSGASPTLTDVTLDVESAVFNVGMVNVLGSAPQLHRVTIESCGSLFEMGPDCLGIWNDSGSWPRLTDSEIHVVAWSRARGILNEGSSYVTLRDSTVQVGAETEQQCVRLEEGSGAVIHDSLLITSGHAIDNTSSGPCRVANTLLEGAVSTSCQCVGAFDSGFEALGSSCQPVP